MQCPIQRAKEDRKEDDDEHKYGGYVDLLPSPKRLARDGGCFTAWNMFWSVLPVQRVLHYFSRAC